MTVHFVSSPTGLVAVHELKAGDDTNCKPLLILGACSFPARCYEALVGMLALASCCLCLSKLDFV